MSRKFLTLTFSILSIIGYGVFVFAVGPIPGHDTEFAPGQTLDPLNCSPGAPFCTVDISSGGTSSITVGNSVYQPVTSTNIGGFGIFKGSGNMGIDNIAHTIGLMGIIDLSGFGTGGPDMPGMQYVLDYTHVSSGVGTVSVGPDGSGSTKVDLSNHSGTNKTTITLGANNAVFRASPDDDATVYSLEVSPYGNVQSKGGVFNSESVGLNLDYNLHQYDIGDVYGHNNGTSLVINDSTKSIVNHINGSFNISNVGGTADFFVTDVANGNYYWGDLGDTFHGTKLAINDADKSITFDFNGDFYSFPTGDGSAGQVMVTDGNGQLSWSNPGGNPNSLYDLSSNISANGISHQLLDGTGQQSIDWQNRYLYDSNNTIAAQWNSRYLITSDGSAAVLWDIRKIR
jgi:hypothetical protein